jgi:glycosyltransferase 2 family protein
MKKKLVISLFIGIVLSGIACYLAFRNVPFGELMRYLGDINYMWMLVAMFVGIVTFFLRTWRWQIILSTSVRVGFKQAFHPLMIGFMMNCLLPGRVGEVARPVILKKQSGVAFTVGMATVVVERLFDAILLLSFFAVVLGVVNIDPELDIAYGGYHLTAATLEKLGSGFLRLTVVLLAGIVGLSITAIRIFFERMLLKVPALFFFCGDGFKTGIEKSVILPLIGVMQNVASGFGLVRQPYKVVLCLLLSFLIWFLSAVAIYMMSLGAPGIGLSFLEMATVMIIICFFIFLPSVPGFWGLWEAGGIFALTLFGVSHSDAAGFTLANHAAQLFPVIVVGLFSAVVTGVNFWQVSYVSADSK